jgi:outer membrane protein, heavy metal efflux system
MHIERILQHRLVAGWVVAIVLLLPVRRAAADVPSEPDRPAKADTGFGADIANKLGDEAVKANPSVGAIENRVSALREQVHEAGAWMDPTFSAEYSNMPIDNPVPGHHPMSGIQFTLKQTLYWPGKIGAREEEARSRVRENELALAEQKVQLRAEVRRAYYNLALARQLRAVTKEHAKLVRQFLVVARAKNEAGVVAQHELLRLHVLADQLDDDVRNFDEDEQSLTSTINATLHRPVDTPIPTPEQTAVPKPATDAVALARRAVRQRPLLKRYAAQAETYRAAARRAKREGYPDITLWAGYRLRTQAGTDPGTDFVSFGLSVPLPLSYDGRWGSERRKNERLARATIDERAAELDSMRGRLGKLVAVWKRAAQEARTYRKDLTPAARLTLEATFASYQVDRADFASLFQTELQLLNFERTTRMAESAAAEARVEVEAIVGGEVQ